MRNGLILVMFFFAISGADVFALTANDIGAERDLENNQVRIAVRNPTQNARKDYIEKIELYINGQLIAAERFYFQRGAYQNLSVKVSELKKVPAIKIKAYPRTGAPAEKEFMFKDVPAPTMMKKNMEQDVKK